MAMLNASLLHCSICKDLFMHPVTICCGHSFCKACLQLTSVRTNAYTCPTCKSFYTKVEVNTVLSELAVDFKKQQALLNPIPDQSADGDVLCDFCPASKDKAVKFCLKCLSSFCETHLEPHRRVAGLKSHPLAAPVLGLENRICGTHHRAHDLYCKTDRTWICCDCMKTDHKNHHVVTLEQEYNSDLAELAETTAKLQGPWCQGVLNAPSMSVRCATNAGRREAQKGKEKQRVPWKY